MAALPCLGLTTCQYAAFDNTVNAASLSYFSTKVAEIFGGKYGAFIESASLATIARHGMLVGVVLVSNYEPYGAPVISLIAVSPTEQRTGIARALLLQSIRELALLGYPTCCAKVSAGNLPSESLFRRCGFTEEKSS